MQMVIQGSIQNKRRTYCPKKNCLKPVNIEFACQVRGIIQPKKAGEVPIILMKSDLQECFFNVSRYSILMRAKTEKDGAQIIKEMWSC